MVPYQTNNKHQNYRLNKIITNNDDVAVPFLGKVSLLNFDDPGLILSGLLYLSLAWRVSSSLTQDSLLDDLMVCKSQQVI